MTQRKDLTDEVMLDAVRKSWINRKAVLATGVGEIFWPADLLPDFPAKVVDAKMQQLVDRGILDYGVSVRSAWIVGEFS